MGNEVGDMHYELWGMGNEVGVLKESDIKNL